MSDAADNDAASTTSSSSSAAGGAGSEAEDAGTAAMEATMTLWEEHGARARDSRRAPGRRRGARAPRCDPGLNDGLQEDAGRPVKVVPVSGSC